MSMRIFLQKGMGIVSLALSGVAVASAVEQAPEVKREISPPQAADEVRTLRIIPEACTWLEGRFTGDPVDPYRVTAKRTAPACQARARFDDEGRARPSVAQGWVLNDLIQIPDASCPTRQMQIRIWRRPVEDPLPPVDAQGRIRIYLEESRQQVIRGELAELPLYSAELRLAGTCGQSQ